MRYNLKRIQALKEQKLLARYNHVNVDIVQLGPESKTCQDIIQRIQYLQSNQLDEYFIFNMPLFKKINSNSQQKLNVACFSLWTINSKKPTNITSKTFMINFSDTKWKSLHKAVSPQSFVAGKFCVMIKKKNVPIVLEEEFFVDVCKLLHQAGFSKSSIREFWLNRKMSAGELAECIKNTHEACQYLKHTKTHTYIMFDVSHYFAVDFVPKSQEELFYPSSTD